MSLTHSYGNFYTYYYASNYIQKSGGLDNISKYLTETHMHNLEVAIKKHQTISGASIKDLENEYNTRIMKQNAVMKKLIKASKTDPSAQAVLTAIVQQLNTNMSQEVAEKIAAHIGWNEATQNLQYQGPSIDGEQAQSVFASWNPGKAEEYRSAKVAVGKIDEAIKTLTRNFTSDQISEYVSRLTDLRNVIINLPEVSAEEVLEKGLKKKVYHGKLRLGSSQEDDIAYRVWNEIYSAKQELEGIANLNTRLSALYSEMIVNIVANSAKAYGLKAFQDKVIKQVSQRSVGNINTKAIKNKDWLEAQVEFLDQDFLRDQIARAEAEAQLQNKTSIESFVRAIQKKGTKVNYVLKDQVGAHGKADANITITTESGSRKKIGVSIKNYALDGNDITLQGHGYLLHYLEGSPSERLMSHILNIYSKHPEQEEGAHSGGPAAIKTLLPQAKAALQASLLYSALSGYMQMRKGQEAELLLIYDKSASAGEQPLVRMYSIPEIVLSMIQKNDFTGVHISPSLSAPLFENEKEIAASSSEEDIEAAARIRMTKVLYEARTKNMSVSLSTKLLK